MWAAKAILPVVTTESREYKCSSSVKGDSSAMAVPYQKVSAVAPVSSLKADRTNIGYPCHCEFFLKRITVGTPSIGSSAILRIAFVHCD